MLKEMQVNHNDDQKTRNVRKNKKVTLTREEIFPLALVDAFSTILLLFLKSSREISFDFSIYLLLYKTAAATMRSTPTPTMPKLT